MHEELHLYRKCDDELNDIARLPRQKTEDIDQQALTFLQDFNNYTWIRLLERNKQVGFLIIGSNQRCHPDCDYFIAQAYVLPKYRDQGRMTAAFKRFEAMHPGKYCMFILHENILARHFWRKTFEELGYVKFNIPELKGTFDKEICDQVAYRKEKV